LIHTAKKLTVWSGYHSKPIAGKPNAQEPVHRASIMRLQKRNDLYFTKKAPDCQEKCFIRGRRRQIRNLQTRRRHFNGSETAFIRKKRRHPVG